MTWDSFAWTPADANNPEGGAAIIDLVPMFRSALDEGLSGLLMGAIAISGVDVADGDAAGLPEQEFRAVSTFELLGTARRGIWVAMPPTAGRTLSGIDITPDILGRCLVDALDGALVALVGEGLGLAAPEPGLEPTGELVLFRLAIGDATGSTTQVVIAVERSVPVELSTHIVALQALGGEVAHATVDPVSAPAAPEAAAVAPAPAPVAAPPAAPAGAPAATALPSLPPNVHPLTFDELGAAGASSGSQSIELLLGVNLQVTVEIGRTRLPIRDVLALTSGSIVELDKLAGEKVDVLVNGHQIASGEVVVVDENFGVRITDVVSRQRRILSVDGAA